MSVIEIGILNKLYVVCEVDHMHRRVDGYYRSRGPILVCVEPLGITTRVMHRHPWAVV